MSKKKVIEEGRGLYQPNERSSVVVDILGRYYTVGGGETVFDLREGSSINIGMAEFKIDFNTQIR